MKQIGNILTQFLKDRGLEQPIKRHDALRLWPEVVGPTVAEITQPQRMSNHILFVQVNNMSWRNELIYYKEEIIKKLNEKIGDEVIKEIKFV